MTIDAEGAIKDLHQRQYRPVISLIETWQDEAGIDPTIWTPTNPATGTAWDRAASGAYLRASTAPNANETAQLVSKQRWMTGYGIYGDNTIYRQLFFDFEMKLTTVANLDNTACVFGLTPSAAATRATNGIIAWALTADALQSVTDSAGVETTNTGFGETLTNWNRYTIVVGRLSVQFVLNGRVIATHTANVPATPMYLNYYLDTEAGGAATFELGVVRAWYEDSIRF